MSIEMSLTRHDDESSDSSRKTLVLMTPLEKECDPTDGRATEGRVFCLCACDATRCDTGKLLGKCAATIEYAAPSLLHPLPQAQLLYNIAIAAKKPAVTAALLAQNEPAHIRCRVRRNFQG